MIKAQVEVVLGLVLSVPLSAVFVFSLFDLAFVFLFSVFHARLRARANLVWIEVHARSCSVAVSAALGRRAHVHLQVHLGVLLQVALRLTSLVLLSVTPAV